MLWVDYEGKDELIRFINILLEMHRFVIEMDDFIGLERKFGQGMEKLQVMTM